MDPYRVLTYAVIILLIILILQPCIFPPKDKFEMPNSSNLSKPKKFTFSWNERADKRKDMIGGSNLATNNYIDNNVFEIISPGNTPTFN